MIVATPTPPPPASVAVFWQLLFESMLKQAALLKKTS